MSGRLFHFTCGHGGLAIGVQAGIVKPLAEWNPMAMSLLPPQVVAMGLVCWFTDLEQPDVAALNLHTSPLTRCDKTQFRYRAVNPELLQPYTTWARMAPRVVREGLEGAPGALPRHWWVSMRPVQVVVDPR